MVADDTARWWRVFGRSDEAFAQRLLSARAGDAIAKGKVSLHYRLGLGTPKSLTEALRWARAGAEQGDPESLYSLGLHYLNGWGVSADCQTALDWFVRAQSSHHPDAAKAVALLTAPPPRIGGGTAQNSELETYMRSRQDACWLVGATADQYGTCR